MAYIFSDKYAIFGYPNGLTSATRTLIADSAEDLASITDADNATCDPGSVFIIAATDAPTAMKSPSGTWEWL